MSCNAKQELINHLNYFETETRKLIAASVFCAESKGKHDKRGPCTLYCDFTEEERESFFKSIDFDYNDSYGQQYLYGNVWFSDGSWSDRAEYDGSEWWNHHECPPLPKRN